MTTLSVDVQGSVAVIRLDRPERRNALNRPMAAAFSEALGSSSGWSAAVITGGPEVFSVGADLHEPRPSDPSSGSPWFEVFDRLSTLPICTIAAIEGYCLGGGLELALCCDLRVAGEEAELGTPEVRHGMFPAGGGTQRLPRVIGLGRANQLLLLGERIPAREAHRWGLVNEVVRPREAIDTAYRWAEATAQQPEAVATIKRLALASHDRSLADGLALEREELGAMRVRLSQATDDQPEGDPR